MAYQPQGGLVYNPPQQQIVTVSSGNPNIQPHYNSIGSRRTGWIQAVCGAICVLLGIVAIFIRCYMSGGYYPIWSGLLFFITPGMAGIWAAKSRTSCSIKLYLVLSIIAGLFSFCLIWVMLGASVAEAAYTPCKPKEVCDDWGYCNVDLLCEKSDSYITCFMVLSIFASLFSFCLVWVMLAAVLSDSIPHCRTITSSDICTYRDRYEACVALDVILLFTALVEFIVSIISASICCRGVCCKTSGKSTTTYTTVSQQAPTGTVVMAPPAASYAVQPSAPASYPGQQQAYPAAGYPPSQVAGYPPATDPAYPPEKSGYPDATAPSAPALDQPPTYEQSVS